MKDQYIFNKYDFKRYLLSEIPDARIDGLIFWKKNIPLPVDLVYSIFENKGDLIKKYIDHLIAAILFSRVAKEQDFSTWKQNLELQPNPNNGKNAELLRTKFQEYLNEQNTLKLIFSLTDALLLSGYKPEAESYFQALCHEGRKYKRIYIPKNLRTIILEFDNSILECIGKSNGDMFGIVVATELNIYRMGFCDAFSPIFNKLLDFVLSFSQKNKKDSISVSNARLVQEEEPSNHFKKLVLGIVNDGSLYEPIYRDSKTSFILNKLHPFADYIKQKGPEAEVVIGEFLLCLSEIESETIRDIDKKSIEILRQNLSKKLRIKVEDLL